MTLRRSPLRRSHFRRSLLLGLATALSLVSAPVAARAQQMITVSKTPPAIRPPAAKPAGLDGFLGAWQLAVEGASYTTDNIAAGTRTVTSSAGAKGRRLVINRDGTYDWGGQKGRWVATGEGANGWPLKLLKADHGHDWKIGWDTRRNAPAGRILVWDGFIWEIGTRAR